MKRILSLEKKAFAFLFTLSLITFLQPALAQKNNAIDTLTFERVMGMKGKANNGEYKNTNPQKDLNVMVDGFKIIPAMGLGTWVAFTPSPDGAMIMGDIIVTETDLKPVQQEVIKQGLTITAIHNHFLRNHPNVMYMHIGGSGNYRNDGPKS